MSLRLHVIDATEVGDRLVLTEDEPDRALVWDHGNLDLTCGSCGFTLAAHVQGPEILAGYVLECPDCGATNSPF